MSSPFCREIKVALLDLSRFMEFMKRGSLFVKEELMAAAAISVRSFAEALVISERTFLSLTEGEAEGSDSAPAASTPTTLDGPKASGSDAICFYLPFQKDMYS